MRGAMFRFLPLVTWAVALAIAVLSLIPATDVPGTQMSDKANHLIAYGVLTVLVLISFPVRSPARALVVLMLYGTLLEVCQALMPYGRDASWLDILANAAGVAMGAVAAQLLTLAGIRKRF